MAPQQCLDESGETMEHYPGVRSVTRGGVTTEYPDGILPTSAEAQKILDAIRCPHSDIEVDSIVTGEILARYCTACGRVEYTAGW